MAVGPATPSTGDHILVLSCPDRPGIVRAVSGFLVDQGANITESQQYGDPATDRFFMRIGFTLSSPSSSQQLRDAFAPVARDWDMDVRLWDAAAPYRTLIMVSRQLHCLNDLLFRTSTGSLQVEVPLVVSNHTDAARLCASYDVPFVHLPVTPATKADAEAALLDLVAEHGIHLVVLARYMQVLSDETCTRLAGRAINIHHSFLPSFKGARPYHQAYDRGVKQVGATAHYVTADLDEGPIIEQDVLRVDHAHTVETLVSAGRDVEAQVLSRAVRWHSQSRVLLNGSRTVVFR
jgi:formyltetrahydrofolate deformylase